MVKLLPQNTKEIEAGYYSFRATSIAPDGSMETLYSHTMDVQDYAELRVSRAAWLERMQRIGYTNVVIKALMLHESRRLFGSYLQGQTLPVSQAEITKLALEDSLSDLNKEFILDI